MASLRAVDGPLTGAVFQLPSEEVSIGRLAANQLCVGDPSVSRQHCLILPGESGFRIRDLGSINGTFVNGDRVDERLLTDRDKIRIGDTVFCFRLKGEAAPGLPYLPDNGVVAVTMVERQVSESADTAIQTLSETADPGGNAASRARTFLKIGAALTSWSDPEAAQIDLLKLILEAVPAEQAAIVLLGKGEASEPTVVGWNRRSNVAVPVPLSRTLVRKTLNDSLATFSDDVTSHQELGSVESLTRRCVLSVIVVPLIAEGRVIGTIYLDSADVDLQLRREHLDVMTAIAEFAGPALHRAAHMASLKEENQRLQTALRMRHNLIGNSIAIRTVSGRLAKIASTEATVMILGETGTGKELAARAIHENSSRARRPFEAINCSLLRDTLLESELFGHEKGSFTGAVAQKRGKLEVADGGTVFLDELGELGEAQQAMLLRVLQTREFQRLGGTRTMRVDIRIIAATNKNLEEAVRNREFREDLFYRLNVVSLTMPPLRERLEDISLLANHFVRIYSEKNKRFVRGLSSYAVTSLLRYDWPGNVRELENAIEYAVVFGSTDEILPEDLPEVVAGSSPAGSGHSYHESVRAAKRSIVCSAMEQASGNYGEAARLLGIHVNNLHRLLRELELKPALKAGRSVDAKASHGQLQAHFPSCTTPVSPVASPYLEDLVGSKATHPDVGPVKGDAGGDRQGGDRRDPA